MNEYTSDTTDSFAEHELFLVRPEEFPYFITFTDLHLRPALRSRYPDFKMRELLSLLPFWNRTSPYSPSELCDYTRYDPGTITRTVHTLVTKRLLQRVPSPSDSRSVKLVHTEKGKSLTQDLITTIMAEIDGLDDYVFFAQDTNNLGIGISIQQKSKISPSKVKVIHLSKVSVPIVEQNTDIKAINANILSHADNTSGQDDKAKILERASGLSDSPEDAMRWYETTSIAALGFTTAKQMVDLGRGEQVMNYLDAVVVGSYA